MPCGARPLKKSEVRRKGSRALGRLAAVFDASREWQNRTAIPVWLHQEQAAAAHVNLAALRQTVLSGLPPLGVAIVFVDDRADAQVRVHFDSDGNWSCVGIDAHSRAETEPTMNLESVDERTVLHEFCHMLGLLHEHSHPARPFEFDESVVIDEMKEEYGWDEDVTRVNILDKSAADATDATAFDEDSIMMYDIPERWTVGDYEVRRDELSSALSRGDVAQLQRWYPGGESGGEGGSEGGSEGAESGALPVHPRTKPVPPDAVLWYVLFGVLGAASLAVLANAASSVYANRARGKSKQ